MSKELVISSNRHETRVAILEDDQVAEVYHQRENEYSLAGSIHKGRVTRVLPGMQSAFVDIGLDRDAFLYVSDFFEDNEEYDKIVTSVEEKVLKLDRTLPQPPLPVAAPPPPPEPEPEEAAPADVAEPHLAPTEAPIAVLPAAEPRRDDRGDRDRRGRRSRRRRGKGGRGLPESKFYSPSARPMGEPEPPRFEAPATVPPDDLLVLPGESLAKYTQPGSEGEEEFGGETVPSEEQRGSEPAAESASGFASEEPEDLAHSGPPTGAEAPGEIAEEPAPEPQPELAVAVHLAEAGVEEAAADEAEAAQEAEEPLPSTPEHDAEPLGAVQAAAQPEAEIAEDIDVITTDAAEPAEAFGSPETAEEGETEPAASAEADLDGPVGDLPREDEGPEPARIPTSLTATLREQGPRYLHRVSRRMRRKGRERGMGPEPAAAPSPKPPEPRVPEPPRSAPEPRTAPKSGADGRPA
ncbi:MAG: ribonuclease, partial [Acidobacteriia bacterium]|nr:ribonuclease [Terriglobia bacterium]